MFLSGVEESAAIAEGGDSGGGLSKIAGRPVREARPKAADVRREKAVRGGAGKWETDVAGRSGVEWSGVERQGRAGPLASLSPACHKDRYTPRSCARAL